MIRSDSDRAGFGKCVATQMPGRGLLTATVDCQKAVAADRPLVADICPCVGRIQDVIEPHAQRVSIHSGAYSQARNCAR